MNEWPAADSSVSLAQRLRNAGERDMLLGALPLTSALPQHLPEYEAVAREVGDPWFLANVELARARNQLDEGQPDKARATLLAALPGCARQRLEPRCAQMELLLGGLSLKEKNAAEARDRAQRGLNQARALGEPGLEAQLLRLLGRSAELAQEPALARAYAAEASRWEPSAPEEDSALPRGF